MSEEKDIISRIQKTIPTQQGNLNINVTVNHYRNIERGPISLFDSLFQSKILDSLMNNSLLDNNNRISNNNINIPQLPMKQNQIEDKVIDAEYEVINDESSLDVLAIERVQNENIYYIYNVKVKRIEYEDIKEFCLNIYNLIESLFNNYKSNLLYEYAIIVNIKTVDDTVNNEKDFLKIAIIKDSKGIMHKIYNKLIIGSSSKLISLPYEIEVKMDINTKYNLPFNIIDYYVEKNTTNNDINVFLVNNKNPYYFIKEL
jgi:hypothetical protein